MRRLLLLVPILLAGCSQLTPVPHPTSIPNPAFPPPDIVDGTTIYSSQDVGNIVDAQRRKNEAANPNMTLADFEATKLLDLLDHAKTAQTVLAVRDQLAHVRELNAMFAKTPQPKKDIGDKKRKALFDSYTKWIKMAADIKAIQFNVRTIDRPGQSTVEAIDLGSHPPSYEEAKKQTLFYARQIPVHAPRPASTP